MPFLCFVLFRVLFVPVPSLGYVLVDILHLDHAELDVFMAKLQVRTGNLPLRV